MKTMDGTVLEKDKKSKGNVIEWFKNSWQLFGIPAIIFVIFLVLFCVLQPIQSNVKKHFITPYDDSVTHQDSELYIVTPYYSNNELSVKFLQTLKGMEKYGIDYYLVDVSEYTSIIDTWNIQYYPTYFVFTRQDKTKEATLLYKSYAFKDSVSLNKEISNVQKYGMPINDVSTTRTITDTNGDKLFEITLNAIQPDTTNSNYNRFAATFTIKNVSSSVQTFDLGNLTCVSNPWTGDSSSYTSNKSNEETLNAGAEKEITIEFDGSTTYSQIKIEYNNEKDNHSAGIWEYKMWPSD